VAAGLEDLEGCLRSRGVSVDRKGEGSPGLTLQIRAARIGTSCPGLQRHERALVDVSMFRFTWKGKRKLELVGRTPLGICYGLFRLADEIAALGAEIDPTAIGPTAPAMPYRIAMVGTPVPDTKEGPTATPEDIESACRSFKNSLRNVLRYGYNIVMISGTENYVPWDDPTYGPRSYRYLQYLRRFIQVAHSHHLKVMLIGDELIYLPTLLDRLGIRASVKDSRLWDFLGSKYRSLLLEVPELDGIGTRIGEQIPHHDFLTLDLIHSEESEPDPRIEERYRRFITTMHRVVAEEFGKIYLNRTWVTNVHEQHSVPQVYQRTFTSEVPVKDLLVAIKLTTGDQWYYYEPFNPTFGLTPHTTIAQGELYSGYHGSGTYLDFPAPYFHAALQWAFERGAKGIMNGITSGLPGEAILYTFSRLAWDPSQDLLEITRKWAAKTFGPEVCDEIAEIFLKSSKAVRKGLYLHQVGLRHWNPLRHLRCNIFVHEGYPLWDNGRGHDAFLRDLYLETKPWLEETFTELDEGVKLYSSILDKFYSCVERIRNKHNASRLQQLLEHGCAAIRLNAHYCKTFLQYFRYRENPTDQQRRLLERFLADLRRSLSSYRDRFTYYNTLAVDTVVSLAQRALDDLPQAEKILDQSPTEFEVRRMFQAAANQSAQILEERKDAILIATWSGTVDGRDVLRIQDDRFTINHLSDDPIHTPSMVTHNPIPKDKKCTVHIKPIHVRGTAFVLEQPSPSNDFTLSIYLEDRNPGPTPFKFQIYAVCEDAPIDPS